MKQFTRILLMAALTLATSALALGQTKAHSVSPEQELIDLDKKWTAAELRLNEQDKQFINSMVGDDFTGTTAEGQIQNKTQYMAGLKHSDDTDVADEYKVRFFDGGKLAVMTHRGTVNGKPTYRSTHVWMKKGNSWQLIQHHGSNIGTPPTQ
ncbi:MAG: nuclear transport factor 2 family protein [Acidobacteria bacterium]|nr:nuclear transport factor 2 family protein [Acidobacteriota bacterium]